MRKIASMGLVFLFVVVFFVAHAHPAYAQDAPASFDKKELMDKMARASRGVSRSRKVSQQDIFLKGIMHIVIEQAAETDLERKIIHTVSVIKDYAFDIDALAEAAFQAAAANARQQGISEDQLRQMAEVKQAEAVMRQQMEQTAQRLKGQKTEQYITATTMFINLQGKWYKVEQPYLEAFWKIARESQSESFDPKKAAEELPPELQGLMGSLFSYMQTSSFSSGSFIRQISEAKFRGADCYALDINDQRLTDMLGQTLMSYAKQRGGNDVRVAIDSFSCKNYIAQDTFLSLGTQVEMKVKLVSNLAPRSIEATMVSEETTSYPSDSALSLPVEVQNAQAFKDEQELQKVFMDSMSSRDGKGQ